MGFRGNGPQGLFPARNNADSYPVYKCRTCDLVYGDHYPAHDNAVFESDNSLLNLTRLDVSAIKEQSAYTDVLDFLKNKGGLKVGAKVLDIGSGIGRVSFLLSKEGYEVYSLEPKKELFDFALKHGFIREERSQNTAFEAVQFEKESFDFIFLEPLNHFADPHEAIQKTLGWLKPGGYLHLQVVNHRWLYKNLLGLFYKICFRKHVPYTSCGRKPFHMCEYSARTFKIYSAMKDLELCQLNSYPCNTYIPICLFSRWMEYIMWRFNRGMELSLIVRKPPGQN